MKKDYKAYDTYDSHYQGPNTIDYIFILDCLNFCFWPATWEYDDLSNSLKSVIM